MTKFSNEKGTMSLWPFAVLALLCVLTFWSIFRNGFVWDDTWFIVKNPAIRMLWPPAWLLGSPGPGVPWLGKRPVTALSFALDYALYKGNPWGFHLTNLLLHILCTLGVVCLAKMVLKNNVTAFAAGALFAVHPGHGEAVVAFIGRSDLLATAFVLLASLFYLRSHQGKRWGWFYGLSLASFLLGCFAKETALAFLGVLVLLEGLREKRGTWKSVLLRILPFVVICALYFAYRLHTASGPPDLGHPWTKDRVALIAYILWDFAEYLRLFLLPLLFNVAPPVSAPWGIETFLGVLGLLFCLGAFVLLWKRGIRDAFGFGWFLLGLAPLLLGWFLPLLGLRGLGKLPGPLPAERWLYLPSVGGCLAVGWGIALLREKVRPSAREVLSLGGVAIVLLLIWKEFSLIPIWRTDESVARAIATSSSNASFAYNYLGEVLSKKGQDEKAIAAFRQVLALNPDDVNAHFNLGITFGKQGKLDEAEKEYREAIRLYPDYADAYVNLGDILSQHGQLNEAEKAFREALRVNPNYAGAHFNLGRVLELQGKLDEAEKENQEVFRLDPNFAKAHGNLWGDLGQQGKPKESGKESPEAVQLMPGDAETHYNLGNALMQQGKLAEAEQEYREAIRMKPDNVGAHNNLGIALCRQGNLDEGEREYREAIRLAPDSAIAYYDLAVGLIQQGRKAEAIKALKAFLSRGGQPRSQAEDLLRTLED